MVSRQRAQRAFVSRQRAQKGTPPQLQTTRQAGAAAAARRPTQRGEALVDVLRLRHAHARGARLLDALAARQVDEVERARHLHAAAAVAALDAQREHHVAARRLLVEVGAPHGALLHGVAQQRLHALRPAHVHQRQLAHTRAALAVVHHLRRAGGRGEGWRRREGPSGSRRRQAHLRRRLAAPPARTRTRARAHTPCGSCPRAASSWPAGPCTPRCRSPACWPAC